ncbi:MAG: hypothetical protein ABI353_06295 [Isosphaeraceae bacterium]
MNERVRVLRWGRLPFGLIGMLVLVAVLEGHLSRHDRDFTTVWASDWYRSGKAARREAAKCDILCFGDSLVKHSVIPRVLEERLGRRVYNLAVFNGQAPTSYFLLRRAIEAGARPSAVLIDGEVFESDPRTHARLWADLATPGETLELARSALDAGFFAKVALARLIPSVKDRYELRANLLTNLRGEPSATWAELSRHWRNWNINKGANIVPSIPSVPQASIDELVQDNYLPSTWNCNPINAIYVKKFLKLAESHAIPVVWLFPPYHPEVQARRDQGGHTALFHRFVQTLQAQYPTLVVVDGRHANYHPSALYDKTHLNLQGATVFSTDIATILANLLDRKPTLESRWINLPTYQDPLVVPPVEDLEQSRIALEDIATRRR